jgi:hypothetical protein
LYNANLTPSSHKIGTHELAAGDHTLRFECVGKNAKSKGYLFGFDTLSQRVPVYTRPPGFDLRKVRDASKQAKP